MKGMIMAVEIGNGAVAKQANIKIPVNGKYRISINGDDSAGAGKGMIIRMDLAIESLDGSQDFTKDAFPEYQDGFGIIVPVDEETFARAYDWCRKN